MTNKITSEKIRKAFISSGTDKVKHGYHKPYFDLFSGIQPSSILEIGVKEGKSLAAWKILFPTAQITGLDISDKLLDKKIIEFADAKIIITDSTKEINTKITEQYDVIIDDGSHNYNDIIKTFSKFCNNFSYAYVIEDIMYNIDIIMSHVKSKGFTNIKIYESEVKNVKVPVWWLLDPNNKTSSSKTTLVSLNIIMIYR